MSPKADYDIAARRHSILSRYRISSQVTEDTLLAIAGGRGPDVAGVGDCVY